MALLPTQGLLEKRGQTLRHSASAGERADHMIALYVRGKKGG